MARQARLGKRVLILDEGGGWRGCGTAWKLAEDGHEVMILSPDAMLGKELVRTAADAPLRKALARLGVTWKLEVSVLEWHGDGATIIDHNTNQRSRVAGHSLVTATTNLAADWLAQELTSIGYPTTSVGDCAAPRQAPYAFFEGRKAALAL
jgi:NADPH-dependent 2,4-dienoyl-CoA reductase/sulfur reductase-like enzyme